MSYIQLSGCFLLEGGNRAAQNELLRLQNPAKGFVELLMNGLILPLQIQHGHWLKGGIRGGTDGFHPNMVAAGGGGGVSYGGEMLENLPVILP